MNRYMHTELYPDFHVTFTKKAKIDEIPTVSLSDLGLPYDVDFKEQKLEDLPKETSAKKWFADYRGGNVMIRHTHTIAKIWDIKGVIVDVWKKEEKRNSCEVRRASGIDGTRAI